MKEIEFWKNESTCSESNTLGWKRRDTTPSDSYCERQREANNKADS